MEKDMIRTLSILIVGALLWGMAGLSQAGSIPWTLSNVNFNGGGTVSGSFVFDADTMTYSAVAITTSPLSIDYDTSEISIGNNGLLILIDDFGIGDLSGRRILSLVFSSDLTNAGGLVALENGFEGICASPDCGSIVATPNLFVDPGGELVARVAVPEPTAILLMGLGLAGLGFATRKTRSS